jgi:hypothetical protein
MSTCDDWAERTVALLKYLQEGPSHHLSAEARRRIQEALTSAPSHMTLEATIRLTERAQCAVDCETFGRDLLHEQPCGTSYMANETAKLIADHIRRGGVRRQ